MKRTVKVKKFIAFAVVLILLMAVCLPTSYALDTSKRRFGALIMSALQAINITMSSTLAPAQNMLDAIADPPGYVGTYEYPWEPDWDNEILDRSSIQIWPDYTEIDGVKYTDVWLSHDAAEKFRVNAFDFKTAFDITSESNGTFASGEGYIDGLPVYDLGDGEFRSQGMSIPFNANMYEIGQTTRLMQYWPDPENPGNLITRQAVRLTEEGNTPIGSVSQNRNTQFPQEVYLCKLPNDNNCKMRYKNKQGTVGTFSGNIGVPFVSSPFEFDWTSGLIPADVVLPSDTGMMIRVPSDSQGLQSFITNNIDFTNEGGINLDFELHPELKIAVDDLFDILAPVIPVVNTGDIQFTINHDTPAPIPDTPIIDATVPQVVNPIINEISNYGDQITQQIPNIIETIPHIDEICNNIDTAPYHDLDTGLDHLPTVFLPFITDLRSALGIWHYVTEWIGQISTTFGFVTGCIVGTSIMTPIYAAIAGFMCIKVYRRMTG